MQAIVESMRRDHSAGATDRVDERLDPLAAKCLDILMACGFQDLTGQRITKVVDTLRYVEEQVASMV